MRFCLRLLPLVLASLAPALRCAAGPDDLPLGLPADLAVPLKLEGYRLVTLDRTKRCVFVFPSENLKLTADVPLYIYLPEKDHEVEMHDRLKAVHAALAKLASQKRSVEPEEVMTIFLALDRVISQAEKPVTTPEVGHSAVAQPAPAPAKATDEGGNPLDVAIKKNG